MLGPLYAKGAAPIVNLKRCTGEACKRLNQKKFWLQVAEIFLDSSMNLLRAWKTPWTQLAPAFCKRP